MKIRTRLPILLLFVFACVSSVNAQATAQTVEPQPATAWQALGNVTRVDRVPGGVELQAGNARVRVVALEDGMVRVRVAPGGRFPSDFSWAVVDDVPRQAAQVQVRDTAEAAQFSIGELTVRIEKTPLRIVFLDRAGAVISEDPRGMPMNFSPSGFRVFKSMPMDEHFYGLGEKGGPFDKRERAYTLWNTDAYGWQESTDPLYKSVPFFLALRKGKAYGIYLDNTWRSSFDFGSRLHNVYSFGADGGELDYYFLYGPHPKQVVQRFARLVGHMPLPPRWALGYQQCRYSYEPEARVREVAREFRQRNIPIDTIYLDIDYQDGNRPFTVDRKKFPSFEDMIADLRRDKFRVIAITDLHLKAEKGYQPYDEGMARDLFIKNPDGSVYVAPVWPGPSVFPDFTWAPAREWWGTLYKEFVSMGIDGFWNDMNEPAIFETPTKTMPLDTVHRMDSGGTATHREAHNILGTQNGRATYEGLLKLRPNTRPFVLTRAAFAGAQRWAATWTGDNSSTWNHLRLTVPTLLGLSVSAYPMVGNDVGGFVGGPSPDLLTRWIQVGVFTPIFRNHTGKGTPDQEPWVHGPEHEVIRRRYIELRYELMPYIYTVTEEASRTGTPMMRPLFLEHPEQEHLYGNERQFFFGSDLLIAPRLEDRTDPDGVQLPGKGWYDYWTGERVGAELSLEPAINVLPIFVRPGAIVPHQPVVQSTAEVPDGPLELRVYPGPDCRGSLYHDDGETFDYQRGENLRVQFTCEASDTGVRVKVGKREGDFAPWWKQVKVTVYGVQKARQVSLDGKPASGWQHDAQRAAVSLVIPDAPAGAELAVTY